MIRFEGVSDGECFEGLNFRIEAGALCRIITRSDHDRKALLGILLSLRKLCAGRVFLCGQDLYSLGPRDLLGVFRSGRAALAPGSGGLISNLNVWDNIVLPSRYHGGTAPREQEEKVEGFYREMGFFKKEGGFDKKGLRTYLGGSAAGLPEHEKKLICIIRTLLLDPELVIYDSPFAGMEEDMAGRLEKVLTGFHKAREGRASVFTGSREEDLRLAGRGTVLKQQGNSFYFSCVCLAE